MTIKKTNPMSKMLILSVIASSIGSFLFGFDTVVFSGTTESLRHVFDLSESQIGFTGASALFGALAGAFLVSAPCNAIGRVKTLVLLALLYLISAVGCAYSWDWYSLLTFRIIGGLAVGGASVVSPMYITEVTPPKFRGVLVAVSQLNIVLGILAAYISNYLILKYMGADVTGASWRWMFGIEGLPALLFLLTAFIIPESPRWLASKGKHDKAQSNLEKLGYKDSEEELVAIERSLNTHGEARPSIFQKKYLKPMLLVLGLAAFNQLDGINAILYYANDIFKSVGFDESQSFEQSIIVGLINLVLTLVGMALIDKVGRKLLLIVGSFTFIGFHSLAAWVYLSGHTGWLAIVALGGIVGSHAFSQGAVIWVCINELLPNSIRAKGSSIACFFLWGMAIVVSWAFPPAVKSFGGYVFIFFALMMVLQLVLVSIFLPETKGKTLEEIEDEMANEPAK